MVRSDTYYTFVAWNAIDVLSLDVHFIQRAMAKEGRKLAPLLAWFKPVQYRALPMAQPRAFLKDLRAIGYHLCRPQG